MYPLAASRMERIKQSGIRYMLEKALKLEQSGQKIIHFEQGRTDFDTHELIKKAAIEALKNGFVHYTLSMGMPEVRQTVAEDLQARLGLEVDIDQVMITVGSTGGIINAWMVILEPGDEVIVPDPMYLFYLDWPEFFGARTVRLPLKPEEDFQISGQALEYCCTSKTKAIVLNSPHNPTGVCFNQDSLSAVAKVAQSRNLIVISDECYDRIIYPPHQHISIATLPGMQERTLLCNSLSKSFAMDGWRLGYAVGPADLLYEMDKAQQHTVINAATFIQQATITALKLGDEVTRPMLDEYIARRKLILDIVNSFPELGYFEPQGAFYLWLNTGLEHLGGLDLANTILEKALVAITPGEVFGAQGKGFIRISYSNSRENIEKGMTRLIQVLRELKDR